MKGSTIRDQTHLEDRRDQPLSTFPYIYIYIYTKFCKFDRRSPNSDHGAASRNAKAAPWSELCEHRSNLYDLMWGIRKSSLPPLLLFPALSNYPPWPSSTLLPAHPASGQKSRRMGRLSSRWLVESNPLLTTPLWTAPLVGSPSNVGRRKVNCRANGAKCRPNSAKFGNTRAKLADTGPEQPEMDRIWPDFGQNVAKPCEIRPNSGRWLRSSQMWSNSGRCRSI